MYARLAGGALALLEPHIVVHGQEILGRYGLRIVRGCDAVDAQILLASALFASRSYALRWRIVGALGGFLVLTMANVTRIACLYFVGANWPAYFDFFHHELWPLLLILLACAVFLGWARAAPGREEVHDVFSST
jgi:exosortase/archaeosortase family protein